MFSSNQKLEISGAMSQLQSALRFALILSDSCGKELAFQITKNGKYCIGWGINQEGWERFQFDFDVEIVAKIISQFLKKKADSFQHVVFDGSTTTGFLMKNIPELFSEEYEDIKNPFYGIVSFEPFINYYAK